MDEVKEEVLLRAFLSGEGMERYELLCKKGWNKSNIKKEKIQIGSKAKKYLDQKHYEKNKRGNQERLKDQKKGTHLKNWKRPSRRGSAPLLCVVDFWIDDLTDLFIYRFAGFDHFLPCLFIQCEDFGAAVLNDLNLLADPFVG